MRLHRTLIACSLTVGCSALHAQSFDFEQFEQIFRPRLRMDVRWMPPTSLRDTAGTFEDRSVTGVFTFPIHSKFSVGAQVDLTADSWKELLQNSIRVRASQLLGSVRFGARDLSWNAELGGPRRLYSGSASVMGIGLTKKFRVLFWSVNVNISEEESTMDRAVPRISGLIGKLRAKGVRRNFFYGVAASYSDGLTLPVPFLGGTIPLGKHGSFVYVLPLQLSLNWKTEKRMRISAGVTLDGWRSGLEVGEERGNITYAAVRAFAGARYKINKTFVLRADAGYGIQTLGLMRGDDRDGFPLEPGPSVMLGVNVLFGESVLERIMDEVLK